MALPSEHYCRSMLCPFTFALAASQAVAVSLPVFSHPGDCGARGGAARWARGSAAPRNGAGMAINGRGRARTPRGTALGCVRAGQAVQILPLATFHASSLFFAPGLQPGIMLLVCSRAAMFCTVPFVQSVPKPLCHGVNCAWITHPVQLYWCAE